jgi:hypothetical protein
VTVASLNIRIREAGLRGWENWFYFRKYYNASKTLYTAGTNEDGIKMPPLEDGSTRNFPLQTIIIIIIIIII